MKRRVLDPCCGSRMFHFNEAAPDALFCDSRRVSERLCGGRALRVEPDVLADVRDLPFEDGEFALVVFDPPHLPRGAGWQAAKRGELPPDWRDFMERAFSECWRVLADEGTLVFKWSERGVKLSQVLGCAPARPLLGNRKPGQSRTHWLVFFKGVEGVEA